jgi:hypothetical protein
MITGKVSNAKGIDRIIERINGLEATMQEYQTTLAILLVQTIQSRLNSVLGDKAKHFTVTAIPNGPDVKVKLTADEIGGYIYNGTQGHTIEMRKSDSAMPIGGNQFARVVHHPGTKPMKDEIDKVVEEAIAEAKLAMGTMRKRV